MHTSEVLLGEVLEQAAQGGGGITFPGAVQDVDVGHEIVDMSMWTSSWKQYIQEPRAALSSPYGG